MSDAAKKRRARHVASDEAHAWARSLPLNNPNAKTVLRALALYVDGEGRAFVGIDQLGEDTDLSADTVRRRLVWLEQVGAIVRLQQWLDANGVRNGEGRGKRTTDLIGLLVHADVDEIERLANGGGTGENSENSATETTPISPSSQLGLNPPPESVSPALALGQPLQCCDHLTSEPEPEISPQPPSGGTVELEGWKEFQEDWLEPITRVSLAQQVWSVLNAGQRDLARRAARGYRIWRGQQKRPPNLLSAHLFLKETDAWQRFADLAPAGGAAASAGVIDAASPAGQAVLALGRIARTSISIGGGNRVIWRGEITPQLLALADVADDPVSLWIEDFSQIAAWVDFLKKYMGRIGDPVHTRGLGDAQRRGMWVPRLWPPRKDGLWSPEGLMTADDYDHFN